MTRDDLRGIIDGITDEQLKRILDIHSADIGKAKSGNEELKSQLDTANSKITELEASIGEAEKLRSKINELQNSIDARATEDAEKEKTKKLEERFRSVSGDLGFINKLTENGIFAEFTAALEDASNDGKSDTEIFKALTDGRDNLFAPDGKVPAVVSSTAFGGADFTDSDVREIMGLSPNN